MNVSGTEVLSMQVDIYAEKEKSATNKRGTRELGGKIGTGGILSLCLWTVFKEGKESITAPSR
jgi:hypothetical protein